MNSACSVSTISEAMSELASPSIDVRNLLQREPSINVRSPGPNAVRTRITFRAFNSGTFSGAFDGLSINDPYHGGATGSTCARNAMPLTLERWCAQRGQHFAQQQQRVGDNSGHRNAERDGARGERHSSLSQDLDFWNHPLACVK